MKALLLPALLLVTCSAPSTSGSAPTGGAPREVPPRIGQAQDTTPPGNSDGEHTIRLPDGSTMTGNFKDGMREGPWRSFFPNGELRSTGFFHQDRSNGGVEVYREGGTPYYTGEMRDDQRVGVWRYYDKAGKLLKVVDEDSSRAVRGR